jgi:hypothetical protein
MATIVFTTLTTITASGCSLISTHPLRDTKNNLRSNLYFVTHDAGILFPLALPSFLVFG